MKKIIATLTMVAMVPYFAACNTTAAGSSETDDSSSTASTTAFPSELAVSSPFSTVSSDSNTAALSMKATSTAPVRYYAWATGAIDLILGGSTPSRCVFDPELFLTQEDDAGCFGPIVAYDGHPDASSPSDPSATGEVLPGDAGLWTETDDTTGHACAAAELNARMSAISDRSVAALMSLASLICVVNSSGYSMPSNSTLDLTAEMTALGVTDTTFNAASISHSNASGSDEYSYSLDFAYAPSATYDIVVDMTHIPGSTAGAYQGRLSYMINDTFAGGNCSSSDVTANGSLLYERASGTDIAVEVRSGYFCGHDADGLTDGLVDPSQTYDATSNPDGWGNNFSIFTADYSPSTLEGNYTYSWQAGPMDGNARIFDVAVGSNADGDTEGRAYFGYGDTIESTDGSIGGFICNWSGPNNDHTLQDRAQYQLVTYNATTGVFDSTEADITYAPTNDCDYVADSDGDGMVDGSFRFDRDLDSDLTDEDSTVDVLNDLIAAEDVDGDGVVDSIAETIEADGFTLPTPPANF